MNQTKDPNTQFEAKHEQGNSSPTPFNLTAAYRLLIRAYIHSTGDTKQGAIDAVAKGNQNEPS